MRTVVILVAAAVVAAMIGRAFAVPPGFEVEFDGQDEGRVVFSGDVHSGEGMYCTDCHIRTFDVSRAAEISWPDHRTGQFCFSCHDGEIAFAPRRNCSNCHEEPPDEI